MNKRQWKIAVASVCAGLCATALFACKPKDVEQNDPPPDQTVHTHSYVPNVVAPACTDEGYTEYKCSCGADYIDDYTAAVGHNMNGDECGRCHATAAAGLKFTSVTGGYAVTGIGSASAADLIIPSTHSGSPVVAIADEAFKYNKTIEYVTLPASVKTIGREAFFGCENLKSVALTAVEEIGTLALSSKNITKVELPETLKIIRNTAFGQLVMDEIEIPASVELVEECALAFCEFGKITVESGNTRYSSAGNCLIDLQTGAIIAGCKGSVIPADGSVTKIADNAFTGLLGVDELVIPDSITELGLHAFSESEIKSLKIGKGVATISYGAFMGCENLVSVTVDPENEKYTSVGNCVIEKNTKSVVLGCKGSVIPTDSNVVTAIAANAFRDAPIPASFVIPSNITSIGLNAFAYSGLESVTIGGNLTDVDGAFSNCTSLKNVTISNGVTSIAESMFRNSAVERISLPESITEIGERAFASSSLTEITIPSGVTEIPYGVFDSCTALTQVVIPNGVTSIGEYAFANCYNLVKVTLGTGVSEIGKYAFNNCNKLTELVNLSSLNIEKSTTNNANNFGNIGYALATKKHQRASSIECYFSGEIYTSTAYTSKLDFADGFVFYNNDGAWELYACGVVGDVTLPTSYKGGKYDVAAGAFSYFTSATSLTVVSGVGKFKSYSAFYNRSLKSVDLTGVEEIQFYAFYQCEYISDIRLSQCGTVATYGFYDCTGVENICFDSMTTPAYFLYTFDSNNQIKPLDSIKRIEITGNCAVTSGTLTYVTDRNAIVILSKDITSMGEGAFSDCAFDTVYYTGTREQWEASDMRNVFDSIEAYCYSETAPAGEGNYWHYAADGVTPVKW